MSVRGVAAGGAGVADLPDGRVVFVHRTAPGDRALVRVTRSKRSWARGELVRLLEPGPERREPPCPFYARCGGCTLEHLEYGAQLRWKGRIVADALERIGGQAVDPPAVRPSPRQVRYRNRVTFTLRRLRGGRVVAGFHALGRPGHVLDVDGRCLLPEEALSRAWDGLRAAWGPGARRLPDGGLLRLTLRSVVDGVVLVVERGRGGGDPEGLLRDVGGLVAVWGGRGPDGGPVLLAGDGDARESWRGETFPAGPSAFVQVNREAATALHDAALDAVDARPGERVVDAYCGVGVYGRALALGGVEAVGIERDPWAARAARLDAPEGFRVLEGDVAERLPDALPAERALLNPPRTGLDDEVCARLESSRVARLVYVSCDPATLARDVERLSPAYRLTALEAFDLFPQTAHVETVAVLDRRADPARGAPCATS